MRVFISHSHQDKPAVDKIIVRLKDEGHDVWVDSLKLRPGDNFQRKIQEGIESADAMIVVISNNSFRSQWVRHEFSAIALHRYRSGSVALSPSG